MIRVKFKKLHPDARIPAKGTGGAACFDLYAVEDTVLGNRAPRKKVRTGFAIKIPDGYCARIYSRSSSFLKGLDIGSLVVDSDYVGEVFIMAGYDSSHAMEPEDHAAYRIRKGDRIAQIKLEQLITTEFVESDELPETARGTGGYGSTGR